MSDRGSCKVFSPNIFNPTKCQNCYKPKEGHPTGSSSSSQTGKIQRGLSLSLARDRNAAIKTVLKEGYLWLGLMDTETGTAVQDWEKRWYVLYSSGELESFPIEDEEVMRSQSKGITVLQDFIRMLDGCTEIGVENSLGLKSLKDSLYLKTANKVDFENWWKELSNFVPSPMKRAYSASAAVRPPIGNSKMWLNKTNSNPHQLVSSKSSSPQSSASPQKDTDNAQMVGLNSKISKLQQETKRIPKLEEEKRKLELEVNYWKEYVTNASSSKKSGSKTDSGKELNETRNKMIDLQDQLNEAEKKLKVASAKALVQSKEIDELKARIEEGNNQINMHKATISDLNSEIVSLKGKRKDANDTVDAPQNSHESKPLAVVAEERILSPLSDSSSERGETGDIELKFLTLREKMKRIEKELFLKSKELEKANESRSKVAKYTRTLLQELEAKLNETQRKYVESNEKLNNASIELEIERERRKRLESERDTNSLSRSSSVSSSVSAVSFQEQIASDSVINESSPITDRSDNEVSNRYVDYYRSRFREAEAALLEKDKKLSSSESKIKELENRYKTVVKQCRSLDDIQVKLSDATHKLSDRQLKIHELTREVEKLRGYERSYERKSKELESFKENLRNTEGQLGELKRKISAHEKDLEMYKIREVVMKERISAFEEESSDESESEDDDTRLERSIETQKRVETVIDLEGKLRLLTAENEELKEKQVKLEERVSHNNIKSSVEEVERKSDGGSLQDFELEREELKRRIVELEDKVIKEEDNLCKSMSELKEKHKEEIALLKASNKQENALFLKLREDYAKMKENCEKLEKEGRGKGQGSEFENKFAELEKEVVVFKEKLSEKELLISDKEKRVKDLEKSLNEMTDDINEKSQDLLNLNDNLEEKDTKLKLQKDKIDYLDKLYNETLNSLKNYERENGILREQIKAIESKLKHEAQDSLRPVDKMADEGRASEGNKELWEDLKKMRDVLQKSQTTSEEMRIEMENVGKKYLESEQKVIELAKELDSRLGMENEMNQWVTSVESKVETMQTQLSESRDSMQTKIDYLEKERNNVIHLVNVTSAYISELENSLTESRSKIDELQSIIEDTRATHGKRIPPEGSSGKDKDDSSSDQSDFEENSTDHRMNMINQELTSKITRLEAEIIEIKSSYENEKNVLLEGHQIEIQALEERLKAIQLEKEAQRDGGLRIEAGEETDSGHHKSENEEKDRKESAEKFVGKNENLDFLNRIQELEVELEETRQRCNAEIKQKTEQHKKEIDDLKDDMAKVLQASIATNYQPTDSQSEEKIVKLEEKIKQMENEMEELEEKYEQEIEMEREAHQYEMEETIRDMLTVKDVLISGKYNEKNDPEETDETGSQKSSRRSSLASVEGLEEIRREYDKKLAQKEKEHQIILEGMKKDMVGVIDAIQHGGASTAILELTNKSQSLRKELDEVLASFEIEREEYKVKIEKLESGNFFGLRRNEEMGTKIYQMQIELEELERKQKLELEAYKNKDDSGAVDELVKINENFEKKIRKLEDELVTSKENSIKEMEIMTMKVHEDKRKAISEMTDTVLSLESIIDEMKERHEIDIKEYEERSQEEKIEAVDEWKQKVEELEMMLSDCTRDCEERLICQEDEHQKELRRLEESCESKVEYYKTLNEEKNKHTDSSELQQINKELTQKIEEEKAQLVSTIEEMKREFSQQTETKQKNFDNQITEIRNEYEEKLKSCVKESARRQSVSSRKTESQKIKELTANVEELQMMIDDQKESHEVEIDNYRSMVKNLQALVTELRAGKADSECADKSQAESQVVSRQNESATQGNPSKTRVEELEDQISRYEKRIDYYRQKGDKNETDENTRIAELQQEVEGLKKEMNQLTESHEQDQLTSPEVNQVIRRRRSEESSSEMSSNGKQKYKRWSDLHLMDVVFTNDGVEQKRMPRDRDSRKRWSDLQLKQDNIINKIGELEDKKNPKLISHLKKDEIAKSGSIARRKKLWENFASDEPRQSRPLSSIRP